MNRTEADRDAVPGVDCRDRDGELNHLFLGKTGHAALRTRHLAHGFATPMSPLRSRPAPRARDRCRAVIRAKHLGGRVALALALRPGIASVHVQAIGAAVDLRGAHLYQFEKAGLEAAALDIGIEGRHPFMAWGAAW